VIPCHARGPSDNSLSACGPASQDRLLRRLGRSTARKTRSCSPAASTFTRDQAAFGEQIASQWTGFARTGNPTVTGAPRWTRYTTNRRNVMSLVPARDSALAVTSAINRQHHCGSCSRPSSSCGSVRVMLHGWCRARIAPVYFWVARRREGVEFDEPLQGDSGSVAVASCPSATTLPRAAGLGGTS
jgi:Carboxylesterase family